MKISLLIHGAYSGNAYDKIFFHICKFPESMLNMLSVTIVSYVSDYIKTKESVESLNTMKIPISIIQCKDLINPGFFNINRQLLTVSTAMKSISTDSFVIKLRNDQYINFNKLFDVLDKIQFFSNDNKEKLLTTNCFTRRDRLYHLSDMFLCGMQPNLLQYYSCPQSLQTHDSCVLEMKQALAEGEDFKKVLCAPEMVMFIAYLKFKKWNLKYTPEDSYNAIKQYCYVVNSWDVDLKWSKKRTPLKPAGALIYPHYFRARPFEGAPIENASCYSRSDFNGRKTLKDRLFIAESKFLWIWWRDQENSIFRSNYFKRLVRWILIIIMELLPYFIAKHLAPIAYSVSLKGKIKRILKNTPVYTAYRKYKEKKLNDI
jgi:hypothetical protein